MTRSSTDDEERGLVTVELALSTVAVVIILVAACWALLLVTVQLRCIDTASAVARQAARGDRAGVAAAEAASPAGADVTIRADASVVRVTVRATVRPLAPLLPAVELQASAKAVVEPGRAGR